jgi:ubiquinone/menaquinone biosynthesis C-methylase UbiE
MENLPERLRTSGATEISKKLKGISGGRILDVATGFGGFINTLMKMLKNYDCFVGIEISGKDLESAKKQFEGQPVEFLEMDAGYLKFEDNSFDTVCISYSLHHLENIDRVLAEMKRVLKPDGCFVVQEEFSDGEQNEAQKTDILRHHWDSEIDSLPGIVHHKTYPKQKIKDSMDSLRLSDLEAFESTHPVRCLICDRKFDCDPKKGKGEVTIDQFAKEIDDNLRRLDEHADLEIRERLKKEGEKLKERMRKYGVANASNLFFIGRK